MSQPMPYCASHDLIVNAECKEGEGQKVAGGAISALRNKGWEELKQKKGKRHTKKRVSLQPHPTG